MNKTVDGNVFKIKGSFVLGFLPEPKLSHILECIRERVLHLLEEVAVVIM